jgi:hypothetical protein
MESVTLVDILLRTSQNISLARPPLASAQRTPMLLLDKSDLRGIGHELLSKMFRYLTFY